MGGPLRMFPTFAVESLSVRFCGTSSSCPAAKRDRSRTDIANANRARLCMGPPPFKGLGRPTPTCTDRQPGQTYSTFASLTGGLRSRLRWAAFEHRSCNQEHRLHIVRTKAQSSKVRKEREVVCRRFMG